MDENPKPPDLGVRARSSGQPVADYGIFRLQRGVRRSPKDGVERAFVRLDSPDWINVIALTTDGNMLLVEQYRHGTGAVTVEIPGGMVDSGETPAQAAARELEEETGYRPGSLFLLGQVEPNPAFLSNTCWTYLARDCTPGDGLAEADPGEEIALRRCSVSGFTSLIEGGTIRHALVIAAHDHLRRAIARGDPMVAGLEDPPRRS